MKDLVSLYTSDDIVNRVNVEPEVLDKWSKYGLLYPAGYYDKDRPYYSDENLLQAEKLKTLMELGYDYDALKQITSRVGLPGGNKKKDLQGKLLTAGEIAERSGISVRTLKYWEEKELINPDARSEGGFRLYRESFVEICYRIRELQLFGYTVEELKNMNLLLLPDDRLQEELLTYGEEEMEQSLDEFSVQQKNLIERMNDLKKSLKRWEGITKIQAKFIYKFKSHIKTRKK